jgi:hypothetical protein
MFGALGDCTLDVGYLDRKEQIARLRKRAAKEVKTPSARIWLERDEFGGIDKSIGDLLEKLEPIRVKKGASVEAMETEIVFVTKLSVLEALLSHAKKKIEKTKKGLRSLR